MTNAIAPAARFWNRRGPLLIASLLSLGSVTAAHALTGAFESALGNRLLPLTMTLSAPGSRAVHLTASDAATDRPYRVDLPVVDGGVTQKWTVDIQALPERHPDALADELWMFAIRTPEQRLRWQDISLVGRWDLRTSLAAGAMDKHVAVALGSRPNRLTTTLDGSQLTIVVGQGEYSGRARISVNGEVRVVDLYAPAFREIELPYLVPAPADYGARNLSLSVPRGAGNEVHLTLTPDGGDLQIVELSLDGRAPSAQAETRFTFPMPGLSPRFIANGAAALVGALLVATCFTGMALATVGQDHRALRPRWDLWFAAMLSLSAAAIGTLLFYPGIFNEDALGRWSSAMAVRNGQPLAFIGSLYPPLMTMLMAGCHAVSGEYGLATLVQAFFFYFCFTLLCLDLLGPRPAVWAAPILAVMPPVAVHALSLSSDTSTATALMGCVTIMWRRRQRDTPLRQLSSLTLFGVSCIVLFGFRYNSLALLPVLLVLVWTVVGHRTLRIGFAGLAMAAAAGTAALPQLIGTTATQLGAIPMLWEHVGMMKEVGDRASLQALRLDAIGNTERALAIHFAGNPDNLFHGPDAPFPYHRVIEHFDDVRRAFWRLAREHPLAFIVNRARTYRYLMAIPEHLYRLDYVDERSVGFDPVATTDQFHYVRSADSPAIAIELANKAFVNAPFLRLLMRPWFLLVGLAAAALMTIAARGSFPIPAVSAAALGVAYYATFFVVSSGAAFRYYFPAFVLLLLVAIAAAVGFYRELRPRLFNP